MAEKLKPCPFCGGETRLKEYKPAVSGVAICTECGARSPICRGDHTGGWKAHAIEAWDRRAGSTCHIVVSIDRNPASYGGRVHRCSACGKALPGALFRNGWTQLDFCPRCGTRVTGVVRDDD